MNREDNTDSGRALRDGLSQAETQEGLGPSGFDPSRVAKAARSLTVTQRQALLRLPLAGDYIQNHFISIRTADALTARGLWRGDNYARRLTDFGFAVWVFLQTDEPQ
jgi:hypothetical protein